MNSPRFVTVSRLLLAAGLVAASAAAQAGGVSWSVNVNAPMPGVGYVSTAVSNRHGVYVQPAPVYYAPQPVVYVPPPPVYVQRAEYCPPRQVVYQPVRYIVEPRGPWGWRHHGYEREWREERREPMMVPRGDWGDRGEHHHHGH